MESVQNLVSMTSASVQIYLDPLVLYRAMSRCQILASPWLPESKSCR